MVQILSSLFKASLISETNDHLEPNEEFHAEWDTRCDLGNYAYHALLLDLMLYAVSTKLL